MSDVGDESNVIVTGDQHWDLRSRTLKIEQLEVHLCSYFTTTLGKKRIGFDRAPIGSLEVGLMRLAESGSEIREISLLA